MMPSWGSATGSFIGSLRKVTFCCDAIWTGDGGGVTRRRKIPQNCVKLAWLLCYRWLRGTSQRLFTGILLLHRTRSAADRQLGLGDVNSALTVWEMLRGSCVAPI